MKEEEIMAKFIPGLELSETFYWEVIRPILDKHFPELTHSPGKLNRGSDTLGFDTPQSMDHDWGPANMDIFLDTDDCEQLGEDIKRVLAEKLPHEFRGLPTSFQPPPNEDEGSTPCFSVKDPVNHKISITTIDRFFSGYIGLNPQNGLSTVQWLLIYPLYLRTIASGRVFHDGLNQLKDVQEMLRWYPKDIWFYLLSCQWRKIDQEEPFMARCGDVGDKLGSRIVATRMVDELMRLCFLMEQQYCPYYKWFGTAFSKLGCAEKLTPVFHSVFDGQNWKEREKHLSFAYLHVAERHNELNITEFIEPKMSLFHSRPYQVLHSGRFSDALYSKISSKAVLKLPRHVGGIAQYVDSTDVLDGIGKCSKLKILYTTNAQRECT